MKKFLSLVLALVMTMSLFTITAGATEFKDLTDVDSIEHKEAVELFNKIGIITGYEDGSFGPEKTITREQAAKIIAIMALGNDAASKLGVEKAPFPDVPATSQFAGYIGYCVSAGIIDGYRDGTFKPKGTLTGYQFAKMLLGVIGYGVNDEYVGNNWALNVARDGASIGLFKDATVTAGLIDRDNATQVAFNALKSSLVTYSDLLGTYVAYNLLDQTLLGSLAQNIFGLTTTGKVDNYGYNVHAWKQDGKIITDYYLTDEIVDTVTDPSVTKGNLYKSYDWEDVVTVWENGKPQASVTINNWKGVTDKYLMNGYTVTLVDEPEKDGTFDGDIDKMIVVKEYLAKVDKVNAATASTERSVNLTVYAADGTKTVNKVETESFEKDDYVLIVPNDSESTTNNRNFQYPLQVKAAETVTGMVSAYYKTTNASAGATILPSPNGSISMDGVKYEYNFIFRSNNALGQDLAVDGYSLNKGTYAIYLDSNGYIAGVEEVESAIKDYAYIINKGHDAFGIENVVKVLLSDGTIKTLTVSDKSDKYIYETSATHTDFDSDIGRIFAYSINEAGEIVLNDFNRTRYEQVSSAVADAKDIYDASGKQDTYINGATNNIGQIVANGFTKGYSLIQYTTDQTSVNGLGTKKYAYATDETIFLYYDASNNGKVTMFVGKNNAPTIKNAAAASIVVRNSKADGTGTDYAEIVVITAAPENAYSSNYFYVLQQLGFSKVGDDNIYYYDVVKNGEQARIAVDVGNLANGSMYYYNYNESKFNGDTVYGTEPGVYEANATNSKLDQSSQDGSQNVTTDKDYAVLTNVYINPNSNVIVGNNGQANTQFLYGDATIVDVTSYAQNQAVKEVVTGATLKSGMDVTIVYAVENNLRVAKTIFITDNKDGGSVTPPPAGGVDGANETYSISLTGANYGTMTVTDRVGEGEDGINLIRAFLTDAGYTVSQLSSSGVNTYIADVTTANGVARTLSITVTNAYKVNLSVATAQQSNYSVTSATTLWMKASDALTVTVKKASGNWAGSESSVALTSTPATYTFTAGSYSFGSGSSDTATFTLTAPANLAAAVSVELGAIS